MREKLSGYLQLMKPTIMLLVIFTGATALVIEGSMLSKPVDFLLVLLGLFLTGGSANALNQYFERDIDALMTRTSKRRPLPQKQLSEVHALIFSVGVGVAGVILFWVFFNALTALLSLGTILFYSLFYTLYLKPRTSQNIVIGGIAGAMGPVGAWAAATGTMDFAPWILFLIIFFWTPPHFWTLALFCKDDYKKVNLPMLPIVKGDSHTYKQIMYYTVILFMTSLSLLFFGAGWFYMIVAIFLGVIFFKKCLQVNRLRTTQALKGLFGYSLIYLFGLFSAIMIDSFI